MKKVILITKEVGGATEIYTKLTVLYKHHPEFSYYYMKRLKFPFTHRGWLFEKKLIDGG